jgi:hypothetical protein
MVQLWQSEVKRRTGSMAQSRSWTFLVAEGTWATTALGRDCLPTRGQRSDRSDGTSAFGTAPVACAAHGDLVRAPPSPCQYAGRSSRPSGAGARRSKRGHGQDETRWRCPHDTSYSHPDPARAIPRANQPIRTSRTQLKQHATRARRDAGPGWATSAPPHQPSTCAPRAAPCMAALYTWPPARSLG